MPRCSANETSFLNLPSSTSAGRSESRISDQELYKSGARSDRTEDGRTRRQPHVTVHRLVLVYASTFAAAVRRRVVLVWATLAADAVDMDVLDIAAAALDKEDRCSAALCGGLPPQLGLRAGQQCAPSRTARGLHRAARPGGAHTRALLSKHVIMQTSAGDGRMGRTRWRQAQQDVGESLLNILRVEQVVTSRSRVEPSTGCAKPANSNSGGRPVLGGRLPSILTTRPQSWGRASPQRCTVVA